MGRDELLDTDQLIRRGVSGDQSAISALFGRHRDRLRRMVAVRMDDQLAARVDPSDVVQEVFVAAADKLPDYFRKRTIPFYPWLRRMAWERIVQMHRQHIQSRKRSVLREVQQEMVLSDQSAMQLVDKLLAGNSSVPGHVMRQELKSRVRSALAALGYRNREVLVLRYLEQLSTDETAAALGITKEAVKSRQRRALEQFSDLIRDYVEEDG